MIFVTVGTHEQQFNRLIEYVDRLNLDEDVFIQTGYSTYIPKNCRWKAMISHDEMVAYAEQADVIITHGGPGSIMLALQFGKIPIVVPRQKTFGEHVNDHQVDFSRRLEQEGKIAVVYDIGELGSKIEEYRNKKGEYYRGNTSSFCRKFGHILRKLVDS